MQKQHILYINCGSSVDFSSSLQYQRLIVQPLMVKTNICLAMKNKNLILLIILCHLLGFVIFLFVFFKNHEKKTSPDVQVTFISNIAGEIVSVRTNRGNTIIRLKDGSEQKFLEANNFSLKPSFFGNFIQKNDSIYKMAYCDTIIIVRNNQKYLFISGDILLNWKK